MSEKHEISRDVKIVKYIQSWRISSKVSELFDRLGTITLTQHEIDAIYAYIHEDDVKVAEDGPSCRKCVYRRICEVGPHSANVCTNYTLPEEWEEGEPAEEEKLVCGNCDYIDDIDDGLGDCYRYPPNSNTIVVEDCQRACGEHRLRE